jgi:hypothetical protein
MADVIDRYRPLMVELAAEIYELLTARGAARAVRRRGACAVLPARGRDWAAISNRSTLVARRRQK